MSAPESPEGVDVNLEYIQKVRSNCLQSSKNLSNKYKILSRIRSIVDVALVLFSTLGAAITILSLIPTTKPYLEGDTSTFVTLIATVIIITQISLDRLIFKDPPVRFRDYAFYLNLFPHKIESELARTNPDWAKIEAWTDLANTNLIDAAAVWPDLIIHS